MKKVKWTKWRPINTTERATGFLAIFGIMFISYGYMKWGYIFFLVAFLAILLALSIYFLVRKFVNLYRKKQFKRREPILRWSYEDEFWREYIQDEAKSSIKIVALGLALGTAYLLVGLIIYFSNPKRSANSLYMVIGISAGIVLIFLGIAFLFRKWKQKNPGETILVRGGVYYRKAALCWNGKSSLYDSTYLEDRYGKSLMVIHYRIKKPSGQVHVLELELPVPPEYMLEAETAIKRLNANPYWRRSDNASLVI